MSNAIVYFHRVGAFRTAALLLALLLGMGAFPASLGAQAVESPQQPPNVLFITIDTLRAANVSSYGYHLKTTPHLDKLAAEGVRFEYAYTVVPRTGPSHVSMFTSRYPQEHGVKLNGYAVPDDSKWLFLPQVLRRFGYTTAGFVSAWPLTGRLTHLDRWFDHWDQDLTGSYQVINSMRGAEKAGPAAAAWLRVHQAKNENSPFFLWVHFFDPHSPYDYRADFEPKKLKEPHPVFKTYDDSVRSNVKGYDSEILYTDHHMGALLAELDELKLRENTLVVVISDHGESLGEKGYQGHSRQLWETTLRIPFVMRLPGKIPAGRVVEQPVTTLDLAPSVLGLTIGNKGDGKVPLTFAGRDLTPALKAGGRVPDRPVRYVTWPGQKWVMPKWISWLWIGKLDLPLRYGITERGRKVVWTPSEEQIEVSNIFDDPFELEPQIAEPSDKIYKKETSALSRWYKATYKDQGETKMDERDKEILKSLGYL